MTTAVNNMKEQYECTLYSRVEYEYSRVRVERVRVSTMSFAVASLTRGCGISIVCDRVRVISCHISTT